MRFEGLDLNLLVALDVMLQERSVSVAAERLGLSQSSTSSALGRLREYFADELLVRQSREMVLTPRALELIEPLDQVLSTIQQQIARPPPFVAAETERKITIMTSDFITEVLLQKALIEFARQAPQLRIEIAILGDDPVEELKRGRGDLLITLDTLISQELPRRHLFDETFVVAGWSENPAMKGEISRELYEELGHVVVQFGRTRRPSFEQGALKHQGVARRVEVIAPTFTTAASLVIGTQRITTIHRRLAEKLSSRMPLTIRPCPIPIPAIRLAAQWAARTSNDPALAWLVEQLVEVACGLDSH